METDEFEAMYQQAVNSYIAVKKGYTEANDQDKPKFIKEKGVIFTTQNRIGKGLYPLIIPKALHNYFLKKIPVRQTILQSTEIKDFLLFRNNVTLEDAYYELIKAFNCSKKFYEEQKMPYYQECVLEISMYFYQRLYLSHFLRSQNEIDSNIMLAILLNAKNHFVNKNYEPKRNV